MAEYSKIIEGTFTSGAVNKFLSLPMVPNTFEWWNETKFASTSTSPHYMSDGIAFAENATATGYGLVSGASPISAILDSGTGIQFVSAGSPTFGAVKAMASTFVTQAASANVTVTAHGYNTGDTVWIYGTTGMLQIAGMAYVITVVDANNFTIPVNSSGFAAAATAGFVKLFKYPDLYIPENVVITAITKAAAAVVTTATNHNMVVGQEVAFTVSPSWGMIEMNGLTGYVEAVTANTFTVNINSTGFTTFAYPTSAAAALGVTPAQATPIGDGNTGYSLNSSAQVPYLGVKNGVIGIPGAFVANTRQGVVVPTAATYATGTAVTLHTTDDIIRWRATFPDQILLNQ